MAVIAHLKLFAEYGTIHGMGYFVRASRFRSFKMRIFWSLLLFLALCVCANFQISLFLDILSKETSVHVFYENRDSAKLPSILICDMNGEMDKGNLFMEQYFGNTSMLYMHTAQIAQSDLFESIRRNIQKNVSMLDKYPYLERNYQKYYSFIYPEWLDNFGEETFEVLGFSIK